MSRTIESIMRYMATPPSRLTDQSNRVEKLEKEITVRKRHYIWAESRFVRTMLPFRSNVACRLQWNGSRRQKRPGANDARSAVSFNGADGVRNAS